MFQRVERYFIKYLIRQCPGVPDLRVRHCVNGLGCLYFFFLLYLGIYVCYIAFNRVRYVRLLNDFMCETLALCYVGCDNAFRGARGRNFD